MYGYRHNNQFTPQATDKQAHVNFKPRHSQVYSRTALISQSSCFVATAAKRLKDSHADSPLSICKALPCLMTKGASRRNGAGYPFWITIFGNLLL